MTRKIINVTLVLALVVAATSLAIEQAPSAAAGNNSFETVTPLDPQLWDALEGKARPHLQFVGKEPYEINGAKGTRYKLAVTNRASLPDSLWHPAPNLPPCGKNENAARTWVEVFGSPGDKRLNGFCALSSSEDLGQIWFAVPAGAKGPPCVYIVMTDRQTGKKFLSNRVCSRLFTVVTGSLKAGGTQITGGFGWDRISADGPGNAAPDSRTPANKKAEAVQADLSIKQFLFPPTNDKALRVHVANTGQAASGACRLVLTVRKINGVAVGRTTHVNVPALAAGADVWLHIDAKSILPNNVSLQSTTFRLNVDATEIVAESNEANNEVWHGLPATAAIGQAIGGFANDGDESDAKPEISSTQQLSTAPSEQTRCVRVSGRYSICASNNFKSGGRVGFSFNRLDPNGKIISTRYYKDCSKLAADGTIPADIRKKAADPCKQSLQLAAKKAGVP